MKQYKYAYDDGIKFRYLEDIIPTDKDLDIIEKRAIKTGDRITSECDYFQEKGYTQTDELDWVKENNEDKAYRNCLSTLNKLTSRLK